MNTAFQSDSKSSNSGSNDNKSNQSTRQSPKPGPSSRTSNPYLHPSTFPASYDGVFLSDNNSFSFSSQYGYPSCNDQDEKHNHGTETLLPNVAQEPILTSCSQYPSGHTDHQQQFQSELHQQQLYQKQLQDHTLEQRSNYHQSHYPQNLVDCSDYDEDKGVEQDFPLEQTDHGLSQTTQRPPRPQSSYEVHSRNFISEEEFLGIAEDYLLSLSPKKREKALLTNSMYQKILMVLLQPKNTQISTAQFRFWAKKMFTLSTTETHHIVCHDGKPVATKECLYDVLVYCHRKSSHGGRDKTSAEVRQHYSWVPKELIARFVKHCPLCSSRRHSLQRPPSALGISNGYDSLMSSTADHPLIDEDGLSRHPWHQGHTHPIQDSSQPDNNYLQQQDTHILSHDRSHSELLQQQHMLNLQTENKSLQRQQSGGVSVRYLNESMTSHHGHYRLSLGSINTDLSTHQFNRSIHVQSNDSGIDPSPKRDETISINYSGRSHGRNKGNKGAEIEQDDTNDESVDDEHNEMEGIQSESQGRSSYHFGSRDQPFSTDRRIDDIRDDDSNDCVPSGMVGVPQDVRRFQPYNSIPQQFQGTSSSSLQNRQSQLSQQHQSHVVHPVQHAHDIFQQRYPSSPGSQPLMGTTVYHPNGHVLHNRHPMHRFSVGKTGYNYGHPNPYSLPADPNTLLSLSKGTHGSIPIFPRQLSAQPPRSHLFTGTSSIHPMEGNYDGVDESDNHGDENDAECSENDQIDDNDDDDDDDDNNNNNDDIQLNEC